MEKNVGHVDKLVRLIFALIFFIMGMLYNPLWIAVSLVLMMTAVFGTCGLYKPFGINTCHSKKAKKASDKKQVKK